MYENISSPLKYYFDRGKLTHEKNVDEFLNILCDHANVDVEQNAKTSKTYRAKLEEIANANKRVARLKRARGFGIFGFLLVGITVMLVFFTSSLMQALVAFLSACTLALTITAIVILCKKTGKKIKNVETVLNGLNAQANELYAQARAQVAPLLRLFSDYDGLRLAEKTFPHLSFDLRFSSARLKELCSSFDYDGYIGGEECVLDALSGELYGNPFLVERRRKQSAGMRTYHGSLTIHWRDWKIDSKGRRVSVTRSQTLTASVIKFAPDYEVKTKLHYGHEIAPNLHFFREGKNVNLKSDEKIEKTVRSGEKKLRKLEEKALREGDDFSTVMNTEFEVLFGAINRDDDLEYRYLFTPRAQESMLELLLCDDSYGDDFDFHKNGKLNTVVSDHAQTLSVYPKAYEYASYDYGEIRSLFKSKNNEFFKSFYFDIAPLLAIPAYQEPLVKSERVENGELSDYNYQILASLLEKRLAPQSSVTPIIYRTSLLEKSDGTDVIGVTALGYRTVQRVDYVSVHGGDGFWHNVPVEWTEYIPTQRYSVIKAFTVANADAVQIPQDAVVYQNTVAWLA